jgi:hypothetical protein
MNERKPLNIKCRKGLDVTETGREPLTRDAVWGKPVYCPDGDRHRGGMTVVRAHTRNMGTCGADAKGESQGEELARLRVPMRHRGADCLVVVMKPGNAGGAKGANESAKDVDQPAMGGIHG